MRRNADGTIHVYEVTSKLTGETLNVDDRTFDPEVHDDPRVTPEEEELPSETPPTVKRTKRQAH